MEALVELVFEIIFEVLGEVIFVIIGKFFNMVDEDERKLKITKIIIYSIIAILLLTLLIVSLAYKKGVIIALVLSYLMVLLIANYAIFFFRQIIISTTMEKITRWIVRILRYVFTISLIIVGINYLTDETAKILLISGSILAIVIYFFIDVYRIRKYNNKTKKEENIIDWFEVLKWRI